MLHYNHNSSNVRKLSSRRRQVGSSRRCSTTGILSILLLLGLAAVSISLVLTSRLHNAPEPHNEAGGARVGTQEGFRGASRSLSRQGSPLEARPSVAPLLTNSTSSACLLIMDDNHWLVEWLAYHYTTINLRHLIIAIDERSQTSPIQILYRYKGRIDFELWNDTHYFRNKPEDADNLQTINLARQQSFLAKCMQTLKQRPNTGWTMFIDTDEFLVINRRTQHADSPLRRDFVPSLNQPGSLLAFLEREHQLHPSMVCLSMGRLQFAPDESDIMAVQRDVPGIWNASHFLTFRWLSAAADLIGPKNVVDLSAIATRDIPAETTYQHQVLEEYCGDVGSTWHRRNSLLQVYHYLGTYEQFNFRQDARLSSQSMTKGRNGRFTRYAGQFVEQADDLRPWIKGFLQLVGEKEAVRLLEGVGRIDGWASAAAHANRFADPKSVPSEWPPGGAPKDGDDNTDGDNDDDDDSESTEGDDEDATEHEGGNSKRHTSSQDDANREENEASGLADESSNGDGFLRPGSTFYSQARPDRSGAAIADMLLAHAYGFAHDLKYGGACGDAHDQYKVETTKLISTIGLNDTLKFDCPPEGDKSPILDRKVYFAEKSTLWNKDYLTMLHGIIQYPEAEYSVALHVRRGDVSPCGDYANRYLPNSHYLDILHHYKPPTDSVAVFSESDAYESFDDFKGREYTVNLDSDLSQVWKSIMTADFVVLSKSSFSFIPAMLNPRATVIYTPFLHPSLPGWTTVDASILARTKQRMAELQSACVQR